MKLKRCRCATFSPTSPLHWARKKSSMATEGGNSYARPQIQEFLTKKSTPPKKKKKQKKNITGIWESKLAKHFVFASCPGTCAPANM